MSNIQKYSLIINADDYGMSRNVNEAIAYCFANRLVTSTSLIVTNAEGLEHAIQLKDQHPIKNVGIHLALSGGFGSGSPLTEKILNDPDFCDENGNFHRNIKKGKLSAAQKKAVYEEFCAQIQLALDSGFTITHLDSHQHLHLKNGLFPIAIKACRKFQIGYVRTPSFKIGRYRSLLRWHAFSKYLQISGGGVQNHSSLMI